MNIEEIEDMWTADAKIDITEPSKELARIPILHAKYSREANKHFLMSKAKTVKLRELQHFKREYYSGNLNNPEDLKKYNIEPFQGNLSDIKINKLLEKDKDILSISLEIEIHTQTSKFAESIIKELNNRTFQLRAIIDHERWIGGN